MFDMNNLNRLLLLAAGLHLLLASCGSNQTANSQLITHVLIIDGTGSPAFSGSVRIQADTIAAIGNLEPLPGENVVDGKGLVLAPGFIDTHSHHFGGLFQTPEALATNNQGITTIVIGQDGNSLPVDSIEAFLKIKPVAVNIATYTGHTSLREQVMGPGNTLKPASRQETESMASLLNADLAKGSLGLSTGLEYEDAFFSAGDEVMQLAHVAAFAGKRYISHIRSEDVTLEEAVTEIIRIGAATKMPVQLSHIKIGMKDKWHRAAALLKRLDSARLQGINITADLYPYTFWNSTLKVLFPKRDYTDKAAGQFAVDHLFDPAGSVLVHFAAHSLYEGKTISEIAAIRNQEISQTLIDLIALAEKFRKENPAYPGTVEALAGKAMTDKDVQTFMQWPHTNICSDGATGGHPRGFGAFTRVLGKYVREQKILSLESAIHKMTGLSAFHTGINKRGLVMVGYFADLVLLDPEKVADRSDLNNGKILSDGIEQVWINGISTYAAKQSTFQYPGKLLKDPPKTH